MLPLPMNIDTALPLAAAERPEKSDETTSRVPLPGIDRATSVVAVQSEKREDVILVVPADSMAPPYPAEQSEKVEVSILTSTLVKMAPPQVAEQLVKVEAVTFRILLLADIAPPLEPGALQFEMMVELIVRGEMSDRMAPPLFPVYPFRRVRLSMIKE